MIFVVRPDSETIRQVIFQWEHMNGPGLDREFFVLFVPRRTIECDELLLGSGMFTDANASNMSQINMDLVPLETDLLSLELPNNFKHHVL